MNENKNIPFGRPQLDEKEIEAVVKVLSGTHLTHGPVTKQFEEEFARRAGSRHAISVSSCTAGLHLSLFVNGICSGDRVAVPAMTHVATAHAVEFCGATPVFIDVDPKTGNMDPEKLAEQVSQGLSAIIVVHYLGLPCDMDAINAIATEAKAFVVEDCALAVDATYDKVKVGNLGLTGCFSFYPVKHMTTIEGGMVTTNDDVIAARLRQQKAFGYSHDLQERKVPGMYDVTRLGYNYRMNEVQAAVGLHQLDKLDRFQSIRKTNYTALKLALMEFDEITVFENSVDKSISSCYCLNAILPKNGSIDRLKVISYLNENGIGTSIHYPQAVPLFTYYREKYGYQAGQFPVAEWLAAQTISLPVAPHVDNKDISYIARVMEDALKKLKSNV